MLHDEECWDRADCWCRRFNTGKGFLDTRPPAALCGVMAGSALPNPAACSSTAEVVELQLVAVPAYPPQHQRARQTTTLSLIQRFVFICPHNHRM